jgi:uncharacterized protein (DUF1330 family)
MDAKGRSMKSRYTVTLAVIAGFGLGAATVEGLRAQAKPPVYFIAEIDVHNVEAYTKVYSIEGAPPKPRVAVQVWDSVEKINAWRNSPEYLEARKTGEKYATFRQFAVEGLPQP